MNLGIFADRFMQHAILAVLFAGIACPLVGVLVVSMKLSFIGVCMSHAAFAGALLGLVLGFNPLVMALIVSVVAAGALGPVADKGDFSPDTAMGVVFSIALGLTFLLLALVPGPKAEALSLLWGSVLTVTQSDLLLLAGVALATVLLVFVFFKEIQAVIFHRELATASGVPATLVLYGLLLSSGVVITSSLKAIGGLLVFSLIVNPAAAAHQLTYDLRRMFLLAALFGAVSGWVGLLLSCVFNLPSGALIVVTSGIIFIVAALFSPKRRIAISPSEVMKG